MELHKLRGDGAAEDQLQQRLKHDAKTLLRLPEKQKCDKGLPE